MGATPAEVALLRTALMRPNDPARIRRASDETVIEHMTLVDLLSAAYTGDPLSKKLYDYTHELSREVNRRKLKWTSRRIPRCEVCKHGTEKLFLTTVDTYSIDENTEFFPRVCVRCWSRFHKDSES